MITCGKDGFGQMVTRNEAELFFRQCSYDSLQSLLKEADPSGNYDGDSKGNVWPFEELVYSCLQVFEDDIE